MSKGRLSKGEPLPEKQVIFLCEGICERVFYDAAIDKLFKDSPIKMRSKNVSGACRFENKAVNYIKEILNNGNCSLLVWCVMTLTYPNREATRRQDSTR